MLAQAMKIKLVEDTREIRRRILKLCVGKEGGHHLGGGLSMVEVITYLYGYKMNICPKRREDPNRDRFILSKGHGVLGFYPVLNYYGFIDDKGLNKYKTKDSYLGSHPIKNLSMGIESSNGSLGHGLGYGTGIAYGLKLRNIQASVYVVLGDGECNEGSVWESVMSAASNKLDNLYCIVDCNGMQSDGETKHIIGQDNLNEQFRDFGFNVRTINGHNFDEIHNSFINKEKNGKPLAILARTVKGKGISFMENNNTWHHGAMTEEIFNQAIEELS